MSYNSNNEGAMTESPGQYYQRSQPIQLAESNNTVNFGNTNNRASITTVAPTKEQEFLERIYNLNPDVKDDIQSITPSFISRQCCGCSDKGKILKDMISGWPAEKKRMYTLFGPNKIRLTDEERLVFLKLSLGCEICSHYKARCTPGILGYPSTVYIYFVRHSESCANVLKRNKTFGGIAQAFYSDPELSGRGEAMAKDMGRKFFSGPYRGLAGTNAIASTQNSIPVIFGASGLLRAQQTADILRAEKSDVLGQPNRTQIKSSEIYVLPYIQESGGGQENTQMSQKLRDSLGGKFEGPALVKRDLVVDVPDAEVPNINKFLDWLGEHLKTLENNVREANRGTIRRNTVIDMSALQMIVVTHHKTLTKFMKSLGYQQNYDNLDGVEIRVEYDANGKRTSTQVVGQPVYKYSPPADLPLSCPQVEGNECRIPVCPTPSISLAAKNSRFAPAVAPTLCKLIDDAKRNQRTTPINTYYTSRLEPIIQQASKVKKLFPAANFDTLKLYKKPGFFSRRTRRNATRLTEDLDDIGRAVGCQPLMTPATANRPSQLVRPQRITQLLGLIQVAQNAVPNYGTTPARLANDYYKTYLIPIVNFLQSNPITSAAVLNKYKPPGFFKGLVSANTRPTRIELISDLDNLRSAVESYVAPSLVASTRRPGAMVTIPVGGRRRRTNKKRRA